MLQRFLLLPLLLAAMAACDDTPSARDAGVADRGIEEAGADLDAADLPAADGSPGDALEVDHGAVDLPPPKATTVWLVGDSTVAPNSGWGDALDAYLLEVATVQNRGRGGRSSKSYYEESNSYWSVNAKAVKKGLAAGDYVLIQFGHNDAKSDAERYTDPGAAPDYQGSYRQYLERYINETRAAGATPILITSVSRMAFDSQGKHVRTHGLYPAAMRHTAQVNGVVLLDLEERSHQEFDALGEAQTLALYAGYDNNPADRTHFPADKAWRVAQLVHELLATSNSPLAAYCKP